MSRQSWKAEVFDRLYAACDDPWNFETSPYEQAKYADTLQQLDDRHFECVLECGCSIGVLSRLLAPRCDRLLGLDAAAAAIGQAEARCAGLDHVAFRRAMLPQDWAINWPAGTFDLIVMSELLYFLCPDDIAALAHRCVEGAPETCMILLVNWTGPTDTPTTGDEAAVLFRDAAVGFTPDAPLHRPSYRLDRLHRAPASR
ncbi:SAM-dependent methyltransferase [Lichenicoccus sp.]|uniref:SAM-dependent methyltransferase n=1 Tax=Lichenicoccus sp. TaxID=2781899 RepID=UPI003D0C095C